jgi:hypothetical protein
VRPPLILSASVSFGLRSIAQRRRIDALPGLESVLVKSYIERRIFFYCIFKALTKGESCRPFLPAESLSVGWCTRVLDAVQILQLLDGARGALAAGVLAKKRCACGSTRSTRR